MIIVLAFLIFAAVVVLAVVSAGRRATQHRSQFIDSPAWQKHRWRDEHERTRAALENGLEDHL